VKQHLLAIEIIWVRAHDSCNRIERNESAFCKSVLK